MLNVGDVLTGLNGAEYEIINSPETKGGKGRILVAKVLKTIRDSDTGTSKDLKNHTKPLSEKDVVVVKVPNIAPDCQDKADRAMQVRKSFDREFDVSDSLIKNNTLKDKIAVAYDICQFEHKTKQEKLTLPALVQEYIEGVTLDEWCKLRNGIPFSGITDSVLWHDVCRELVSIVRSVHDDRIVHADIWPPNIIIKTRTMQPVLIDFGQAWREDIYLKQKGLDKYRYPYYAPERIDTDQKTWNSQVDIFGLGGVLFFLATGQDPNFHIHSESFDDLRNYIVGQLIKVNPVLYKSNPGIADIIFLCVRKDPSDRARYALAILQLMDVFFPSTQQRANAPAALRETIDKVARYKNIVNEETNPLFCSLVRRDLMNLEDNLSSMRTRLYTLSGDRESLLNGMLTCLNTLEAGDECLALTTLTFWSDINFGDGRLLTMLKLIAERGVTIKWVILLSRAQRLSQNPDFKLVERAQDAQLRALDELSMRDPKVQDAIKKGEEKGYYISFHVISEEERSDIILNAKTFILLNKKSKGVKSRTLLAPAYTYPAEGRIGGTVSVVRVWSDPDRWEADFEEPFTRYLNDSISVASPISDHEKNSFTFQK